MQFDLIITGGTVIDGTGAARYSADVGISDDRIAAIAAPGSFDSSAETVIKAKGSVVAPGFIDIHAHDDRIVLDQPELLHKVTQGVTTTVCGNCGSGLAPITADVESALRGTDLERLFAQKQPIWPRVAEYLEAVEEKRPAINFAYQTPHRLVRAAVMGGDESIPGPEQLSQMQDIVRQAMEGGAIGLSSGFFYTPGRSADHHEMVPLLEVLQEYDGFYATHMRDEGTCLLASVAESIATARAGGARLQISHLKGGRGPETWGLVQRACEMIDEARRDGLEVCGDQYPYTASSTTVAAYVRTGLADRHAGDIQVCWSEPHPDAVGKRLDVVADEMGLPPREAAEALLPASGVYFGISEDDMRFVMQQPWVSVGSDGVPGAPQPHPRAFGTFPRVLGHYVRDEGVLSLEAAVRKMTSLSAGMCGFSDRGTLRVGAAADIVVFDAEQISDVGTYEDPCQHAVGISHVIVGGEVALEDGAATGAQAGKVLRGRQR
ncbi:MAG: amidohydrolase family protein [Armatimonadota bacterium]